MGRLISWLEKAFRALFPKTRLGENLAGGCIWLVTVAVSFLIPWGLLKLAGMVSCLLYTSAHRATMCLYLSTRLTQELQQELLEGGYPGSTPVAIVFKASWPDERIFHCTVDTLSLIHIFLCFQYSTKWRNVCLQWGLYGSTPGRD